MRVPTAARLNRDVGDSGLDQPAGQQAALPEIVATVLVAEQRRFRLHLKRSPSFFMGDHLDGVAVELVEPVDVALRIDVAANRVQLR